MIKTLKTLFHRGVGVIKKKTLSDEYLNWLCFANAGMLDPGNIYAMDIAVRTLPSDSPAVEIGSFCGLSVNAMEPTHKLKRV